jgi:predicted esterase
MPGWYDIKHFGNLNGEQDETGILKSREYFHGLIKQEIDGGIPSERIVIGGFSQGGAMSLITGITSPTKLGGIFGLSCYLLLHNKVRDLVPADNPNKDTPIFMGHGTNDPLILPRWGEMTANFLKEWGWKVDLKMYPYVSQSHLAPKIPD